jgi:hypothetical protein
VSVEYLFTWDWRAALCARTGIRCVLGHALCMKSLHGGKAKHDTIDAHKMAVRLRGGLRPRPCHGLQAVVLPRWQATRVSSGIQGRCT